MSFSHNTLKLTELLFNDVFFKGILLKIGGASIEQLLAIILGLITTASISILSVVLIGNVVNIMAKYIIETANIFYNPWKLYRDKYNEAKYHVDNDGEWVYPPDEPPYFKYKYSSATINMEFVLGDKTNIITYQMRHLKNVYDNIYNNYENVQTSTDALNYRPYFNWVVQPTINYVLN